MNPFEHDKRKRKTPQWIARLFSFRNGRCGVWNEEKQNFGDGCGWKFGLKGNYEIDHMTALARGGEDGDDLNMYQLLCDACHSKKTSNDLKEVGHIRRSFTNHVVPTKFRRSRSWRT